MAAARSLEELRRLVLADPALQARLRSIRDWPAFAEAAVEIAAEHGIVLDAEAVLAARDDARRTWRGRWV